jgi:hypothetical protein
MKKIVLVMLVVVPFLVNGQNRTVHTNMIWAGYFNTLHFNDRWALMSDFQIRTKDWTRQWSQVVLRSGGQYSLNRKATLSAGLSWFKNAAYTNKDVIFRNEWRPWEEFSYKSFLNKKNNLFLIHRVRTEQRFIEQPMVNGESDYSFVFRFRYKIELQFPLGIDQLSASVANEIMVNPADISNSNFFDQNRIFAGVNWKVSDHVVLQWQYLKILQRRNALDLLEDQDVLRFNVRHDINFKKKS